MHHGWKDRNQNRFTCPLNDIKINIVVNKDLEHVHLEPADIRLQATDANIQMMTHCFTFKELEQLWSRNIESTISNDERLTLYWNYRLQCVRPVILHWLAYIGVLSKSIYKVDRVSSFVSCAFAMTHCRGWRTKFKNNRSIRNINKENREAQYHVTV